MFLFTSVHPDQSRIICSSDGSNSAVIQPILKKGGGGTEDGATSNQTASPLPRSHHLHLRLALLTRYTGLFSISYCIADVIFILSTSHLVSFNSSTCFPRLSAIPHISPHSLRPEPGFLCQPASPPRFPTRLDWTSWRSNFLCRPATALLPALCWPPGCGQG